VKYLIAGLGNIGPDYTQTRHNIGFMILDALAGASNLVFNASRYGDTCSLTVKGRTLVMLKPSTFMNRSGLAVRYWMQKEQIEPNHLLVVTDDMALPHAQLRLRKKGGDGGHNGLSSIIELIGTQDFARLRFGIGKPDWVRDTAQYVLSDFTEEELKSMTPCIKKAGDMIISFALTGADHTMNQFNRGGC